MVKAHFSYATPEQAAVLSEIAIQSKGYWGYSAKQLEVWRSDLAIQPEYIESNWVRTIWSMDALVGFYALVRTGEVYVLDHLWILPRAIGCGLGKQAFLRIKQDFIELGAVAFTIISDPNAEAFYLRLGCIRVGEVPSEPQNRLLPKLIYRLAL
ncbi:MAG: GNAT family N-acetyltransferase [Verrucomicrobiota bacterium]